MKPSSKLSHFRTEAGKKEFLAAYHEAMALLPPPTETKDITTDFGSVRVYAFVKQENGHKDPIVLLPGRSASTPMWEPNIQGLLEERPVYSIDALGEPGLSVQTAEIKGSRDQALWLHQVLSALPLKKAHLMSVSFGGWAAMNLVRAYPEAVASLSLLDPVFVFVPISAKVLFLSLPATIPIVPKPIREKMLGYISGGIQANERIPVAKLIAISMKQFAIKLPPPDQFSQHDLRTIHIPVLALMAEKSAMHDARKAVENGKKWMSTLDIELWPNASHAINGEYPREINKRVLSFIEHHAQ